MWRRRWWRFLRGSFLGQLNRHPLFSRYAVALGQVHLAATLIRVEFNFGNG